MKVRTLLIVSGISILVAGIVFYLQGRSIVGPESSFMYSNPQWVDYGAYIMVLGLAVFALGIIFSKKFNQ